MKTLYRPLSIVISVGGGLLAHAVFQQVWRRLTGAKKAPKATDRTFKTWQVVAAAAAQGAIIGAVRAAVDRAGAAGYEKVTGAWPGNE
ncbi:DUF4235 domain-containing protein [Saccharomonospora viridis]|jgi:hypothetical protein|uniref:DUF4235 domain-containing protein n=2 Tax=Saccharomonospora viridis TaxID=1852 RepID=C7MZS7_SACVD|nr:DUF4235 domain-containing protein [Saccharomonospora viridis]ACU96195.1 hypothetical protein Svir_11390 [Saccharomonospora viridis DSM 43017]KHF45299.1 membrane protein [Saccharomonospora viridis]SFP79787.1 Protein of unknown function [Saccharomonospora viridis]